MRPSSEPPARPGYLHVIEGDDGVCQDLDVVVTEDHAGLMFAQLGMGLVSDRGCRYRARLHGLVAVLEVGLMSISETPTGSSGTLRLLLVALLASSLLLVSSVALAAPVSAANGPRVFYGGKAGPVKVPAKLKTVASMALPNGGWLIMAKAQLVGIGGSPAGHLGVQCRLTLGKRSDHISAAPTPLQRDGSYVPVLLTLASRVKNPAKANLRCVGEEGGNVVIRSIRMTAMKTGKLSTRVASSPPTTTGSGMPVVLSAKYKGATPVLGDSTYRTVGKLGVGRGAWWFVAKAVASNGNTTDDAACLLDAGGDFDVVDFGMSAPGYAGDSMPLGLQVVHVFDALGQAVLSCKAPYGFKVRDVVISAIKAGRLTNHNTDGGPAWTVGSGSPKTISGWSNGPTDVPGRHVQDGRFDGPDPG